MGVVLKKVWLLPEVVDIANHYGNFGLGFLQIHTMDSQRTCTEVRKTPKATWDDLLMDNNVFTSLAHIVPVIIVRVVAPILFQDFEGLLPFIGKLTEIYTIVVILMIINALLRVMEQALLKNKAFSDKPVASYVQLIRIILYIAAGILILSILMGKSPTYFLTAFGAMTALIMLIFKDTILGLVPVCKCSPTIWYALEIGWKCPNSCRWRCHCHQLEYGESAELG